MNLRRANGSITVILSKRNVAALYHKAFEFPNSQMELNRLMDDGTILRVRIEEDGDHYGDREPGIMHQDTERFIEEHK